MTDPDVERERSLTRRAVDQLGNAAWTLLCVPDTPFSLTTTNIIHSSTCRWQHGEKLTLVELVLALQDGARGGECCGAYPSGWLRVRAEAFTVARDLTRHIT